MNEAKKYVKSCVLTQNIVVFKNCFMFFIMKQPQTSVMVCYSIDKCVLWNVPILIKLKEHNNSPFLKNVQNFFCGWDGSEIRVFILYECNKEVVTDIFKNGRPFWNVFFSIFMCMTLLFCDYENKVGIKLILYVRS